jgi:hypothetical protein
MNTQATQNDATADAGSSAVRSAQAASAERIAAAYGLAVSITVVFNTLLTWGKEAYHPLKSLMVLLTGHHWITHGLVVLAVFLVLGWAFAVRSIPAQGLDQRLAVTIAVSILVGGIGLLGGFLFF